MVHAAVLLWTVVFFVIIAPGHTRGFIEYQVASLARPDKALGGEAACEPVGDTLTPLRGCCQGGSFAPAGKTKPRPKLPKRCAICEIVAKLDCPQPFITYEHVLALLGVHTPQRSDDLCDLEPAQPFAGRAPPAIA